MITIFSLPKAFVREFDTIQKNAIMSWTRLRPKPEVLLFGDEHGTRKLADSLGLKHIQNIERNRYNTPLLDDLFHQAHRYASHRILCYVNADIIFKPASIVEPVRNISASFKKFLIVGRRYEQPGGFLKGAGWIDYFIFSKGIFDAVPPFALGRTFWDKWLLWYAVQKKIPVIDATHEITAIHQTHSYFHTRGKQWAWEGREALENIRLAGGWSHGLTINEADFVYKDRRLIPHGGKERLDFKIAQICRSAVDRLPLLWPSLLRLRLLKNSFLIQ